MTSWEIDWYCPHCCSSGGDFLIRTAAAKREQKLLESKGLHVLRIRADKFGNRQFPTDHQKSAESDYLHKGD